MICAARSMLHRLQRTAPGAADGANIEAGLFTLEPPRRQGALFGIASSLKLHSRLALNGARRGPERFPCSLTTRSMREEPDSVLRHRHG